MKTLPIAFAVAAMAFASCSQNDIFGTSSDDEVSVKIQVSSPESMDTRAYSTASNSEKGGVTNVNFDEVDLRYILEIWNAEGTQRLKALPVQTKDVAEDAFFEFRLAPNRTYKFVAWADFVKQGDIDDNHYNTAAGLQNIVVSNHAINDETRDAYFASKDLLITPEFSDRITLRRPFGKVRAIATDMQDLTSDITPTTVEVRYTSQKPTAFNAVDGTFTAGAATEQVLTATLPATKEYVDGLDKDEANRTLFVDYVLAKSEEDIIPFKLTTYDQNNVAIRTHEFITNIPVKRNMLTTLKGYILTTGAGLIIEVDEVFEDYHNHNVTVK